MACACVVHSTHQSQSKHQDTIYISLSLSLCASVAPSNQGAQRVISAPSSSWTLLQEPLPVRNRCGTRQPVINILNKLADGWSLSLPHFEGDVHGGSTMASNARAGE